MKIIDKIQDAICRIRNGEPVVSVAEAFYDSTMVFMQYSGKDKSYVELFKNPTTSEVRKIASESEIAGVRIGVVPSGTVYVWNADVLHHTIESYFKLFFVWELTWDEGDDKLYTSPDQKLGAIKGLRKPVTDVVTNRLRVAFPKVTGIYDERGKKALLKISNE